MHHKSFLETVKTVDVLFAILLFTGYPIIDASCVALNTAREWLEHKDEKGNKNADLVSLSLVYFGEQNILNNQAVRLKLTGLVCIGQRSRVAFCGRSQT